MMECPLCGRTFPKSVINEHANQCLTVSGCTPERETENESTTCAAKRTKFDSTACDVEKRATLDTPTLPTSVRGKYSDAHLLSERPGLHQVGSSKDSWKSFFKKCDQTKVLASSPPLYASKPERNCGKLSSVKSKNPFDELNTEVGDFKVIGGKSNSQIEDFSSGLSEVTNDNAIVAGDHIEANYSSSSIEDKIKRILSILTIPLAEKMRPTSVVDYVGQGKLIGSNKPLRALIESNRISSMIFWGPPGCGKTTMAKIIASNCRQSSNVRFVSLSGAICNIADVKEAIKVAKNERLFARKTILFVDEIHRFNKLQQDAFLPHVEDGTIVLLGATTENPSFHVNSALLSRCQVIVLEKLEVDSIRMVLCRAIKKLQIEVTDSDSSKISDPRESIVIQEKALDALCSLCDGDARVALNGLETVLNSKFASYVEGGIMIAEGDIKDALQRTSILYDRTGDEHYNCASALQKSIRGSDDNAAIYWLARMLEGGEDPLFIARRLVVTASEDIGLADSQALPLAVATFQACHFIGLPECSINLAHCTTYLARANKSNESYAAFNRARSCIKQQEGPLPGVPLHLRNATSGLAKQLGYHAGYQYNHDVVGPISQVYLPSQLVGTNFFKAV